MEAMREETRRTTIIMFAVIACVLGFIIAMIYGVPVTRYGMRYADKYSPCISVKATSGNTRISALPSETRSGFSPL